MNLNTRCQSGALTCQAPFTAIDVFFCSASLLCAFLRHHPERPFPEQLDRNGFPLLLAAAARAVATVAPVVVLLVPAAITAPVVRSGTTNIIVAAAAKGAALRSHVMTIGRA